MEKKSKRRTWLIISIIFIAVILLFSFIGIIAGIILLTTGKKPSLLGGNAVAVIRLDGVISSSEDDSGLFGSVATSTPEIFSEHLKEALDDDSVKAIVIRVNSPGGSPAASQEMYKEVQKAAKKKPVVASVADVAASGSYYVISPVAQIMASPASDIGSIGVFIEVPNLEELYRKLGIRMVIIKEGKYKAMGDPSKPLTNQERAILQNYAKEIYNQFINDVAKGRKQLSVSEIRKLASGRTWPGSQAKELKLIDSFGNYQDAIKRAAKLGKIEGEPEIITYEEDGFFPSLEDAVKALKNIGKIPQIDKNFR